MLFNSKVMLSPLQVIPVPLRFAAFNNVTVETIEEMFVNVTSALNIGGSKFPVRTSPTELC